MKIKWEEIYKHDNDSGAKAWTWMAIVPGGVLYRHQKVWSDGDVVQSMCFAPTLPNEIQAFEDSTKV